MPEFPQLSRPPIVEAIIDIRFAVPDLFEIETLRPLAGRFHSDRLPHLEERKGGDATIEIRTGDGQVRVSNTDPVTARFVRSDYDGEKPATRTLLWSRDGIAVSHATPYRNWETVLHDAKEMFSEFVAAASPQKVTRVAARYLNKIPLPPQTIDLDDYFVGGPKVPENAPQSVFDFSHRVGIECGESMRAWLKMFMDGQNEPGPNSIILDIDVFVVTEIRPEWDLAVNILSRIRQMKNTLFFGTLKDKAVEKFL